MTNSLVTFRNGLIFDGTRLLEGHAARFENGCLIALAGEGELARDGETVDLNGDILSHGFVDLQVNGGGGVMFNDDPSVKTLTQIAKAHRRLGTVRILPTLITDTPTKTLAALQAVAEAIEQKAPGIAGLHLEGPHISIARKGAHDAALIRPMEQSDCEMLLEAAGKLPVLKVTLAPEAVSVEQVTALANAGILVSLGHTDANYETCQRYFQAGARCTTHLFNAMSQLGSREPGLVGATLASDTVAAGLICDAIHVHPATITAAWHALSAPARIYLVSDAMAVTGSDLAEFQLGGRKILRRDGRLSLEDGTLAGADLHLAKAVQVAHDTVGLPLVDALAAASTVPAEVAGLGPARLRSGASQLSEMIRISRDLAQCGPCICQL